MKKLLLLLSVLALTFGCYDDSDIRSELREHEARLTTLETLCQQANSNIEALQTAVSALEKNVYVSAIVPVKKNGEVIGYAISFTNAETITIYHGQDGDKGEQGEKGNDGATPAVGLKRDADGIYYWTLNGEWLLDDSGKKVPASGKDGADGLPGASGPQGAAGKDGVTPQLKIEEGYWYVSYDGGKTWEDEPLGQATGDKGYTMFEMVEYDEEYLYITMTDGEKLTLPRMDHGHGGVGPLIWSIDAITDVSATITGSLSVPVDDLAFSKVTVCYSDGENFNVYDAKKVSTTTFDADQKFSISITGLNPNVRYNYCLIVKVKSEEIYGKLESFTTLLLLEEGGNLDVSFGEVKVGPSTISVPVESKGASMIYYALLNNSDGYRYSSSEVPDAEKFQKMKENSFVSVKGSAATASFSKLNPSTSYWVYAVAVDADGKYGPVTCVSGKTEALVYDNSISLKVEMLERTAKKMVLKVTSTGGDLSDYIYWTGRITDPFWANSTHCGGTYRNAQKYMALNPDDENITRAMNKYGPLKEDGTIVIEGLTMETDYAFAILEKGEKNYSPIGYIKVTTLVTPPVSEEVAVNSSSILGDWEITNRVWEYIEDGKVVDAEEEPVEGQDDIVFTLVEDSDKIQAKLLHNSAESLNL